MGRKSLLLTTRSRRGEGEVGGRAEGGSKNVTALLVLVLVVMPVVEMVEVGEMEEREERPPAGRHGLLSR
jgi:hypothetical protein